jgi:hypothetical protein
MLLIQWDGQGVRGMKCEHVFGWQQDKIRNHFEDIDVHGKIILNWALRNRSEAVDWIRLAFQWPVSPAMNLAGSIKWAEFVKERNDYKHFEEDPASWSFILFSTSRIKAIYNN